MKTITIQLDNQARTQARDFLKKEGEILETLCEMKKHRSFIELNCTGVFEYCEGVLRLSRAQAYYFKTVCEKSETVPEIKLAVMQGSLSLSQARRIVPVITKDNHAAWIKKAMELPQVELEREVSLVNPNAIPREKIKPVSAKLSELRTSIDTETESNLKVLQDLLSQKLKKPASLSDVIAWAAKETREKHDPLKKALRSTKSGNAPPPKPGRHPIAARVRHEVTLRDNRQCTELSPDGRRCTQRRWLDFHHVIEVALGGLNEVSNLRLMCSAHHRMRHRQGPQAPGFTTSSERPA